MTGKPEGANTFLETALSSETPGIYLQALLEYILNSHHKYALDLIPTIEGIIKNLANEAPDIRREINSLKDHFKTILEILDNHFLFEETVIFRYMKILIFAFKSKLTRQSAPLISISNSMKKIEADEEKIKTELNHISEIGSMLTEKNLPYLHLLTDSLITFRNDLIVHMFLEERILYPFTLEIERRIKQNYSQF